MERVPRTGASVYCQPPPPPDLLPVVASVSAEPVPPAGLPVVVPHEDATRQVPAVLSPHVVTVHVAHMAVYAQAMYNPAQVLSCGRHRWLPRRWYSIKEEVNQYNNRAADKQRR